MSGFHFIPGKRGCASTPFYSPGNASPGKAFPRGVFTAFWVGLLFLSQFLPSRDDFFLHAQSGPAGVPGMNVQEREAAEKARAIGFGDLEIDNLHAAIARKVSALDGFKAVKESKGSHLWLMKGRDSQNKTYYRVRIREGMSFSMETHPKRYIFKSHCYFYLNADKKNLDRLLCQFYRINFSGSAYNRELRRMVHPSPRSLAGDNPLAVKADIKLQNNSKLLLELYDEPSNVKPVWEGPDGVPQPEIKGMNPREKILLHNPANLMPYDKQVRVITRYKKLLRAVDRELRELVRGRELERRRRIERIMDFPA